MHFQKFVSWQILRYKIYLGKIEFFKSSVSLNIKYSSEKKIENQYINTSIKDIYKKYSKHFQDPTRVLLDPIVEFVRRCPYLELEPHIFLLNEMKEGNEQHASLEC